MNDVAEGKVGRIDAHANLLARFADRALDHRFPCLQVPRGRAQLAVGVASARALQQEDYSIRTLQEDVDVDNAAVAIRYKCPFRFAAGPFSRVEVAVAFHSRRA